MKLLTPKELAERWSLSEKTLANWRTGTRGPAFVKIGGRVRYRLDSVESEERIKHLFEGGSDNGNSATEHTEADAAGLREDHSESEGD